MPHAQLMQWLATADARDAFTELQTVCGITCVIIGARSSCTVETLPDVGPYGAIVRALGRSSASDAIAPHDVTLALTMRRDEWQQLAKGDRAKLVADAKRMSAGASIRNAVAQTAPHVSPVADRVAEAVVAGMANHDALTRRINASYFAFKAAHYGLRSKNAV